MCYISLKTGITNDLKSAMILEADCDAIYLVLQSLCTLIRNGVNLLPLCDSLDSTIESAGVFYVRIVQQCHYLKL